MGPAFFFFFPDQKYAIIRLSRWHRRSVADRGPKRRCVDLSFWRAGKSLPVYPGLSGSTICAAPQTGEGKHPPNTNCATSMVNSFSIFPIQSQKNTTTSSSKHVTKDFPYPCLRSVLKHRLLLCLPKSYLPIDTTAGTFSESESLPGELDIISPNSGWGGSLLPVNL